MADIRLTLAMTPYDRIKPLITGEVKPEGIELEYVGFPGGVDVFYHQLKFDRYDISEISFSSYLIARSQGWGYRLLPVFHNRDFAYARLRVREGAGIDGPQDLKGKRIGSADYQQTAALWIRGVFQHEFNIKPEDMIWYQERSPNYSHGGASGSRLAGVKFQYAHEKGFEQMLIDGELDIPATYQTGADVDKPKKHANLATHPLIKTKLLFPNPMEEAVRYYKKNGVYPTHHTTAVRESILEKYPWIATSLFDAFERAKKLEMERLYGRAPSLIMFADQWVNEQRSVFGDDPFVYGLKANAKVIDMVQTFSVEQGLTERKQPWEEIFAEEILLSEEKL